MRIGEMSDLDLVRVIRDHGRQGGLVGVGGLGRGHSGGGYTRAGDREGHEPAARDSGAVGAVGMRHAAPSIRGEVRAVRVQAPGEEVRIGEMSDLDLVRVIRDHGRQGGLVGVGGLGRGHSGGGYTRAGDREGHEPAARDSGAVGAVGMRHAAPSIRVHMPH